MSMPLLVVLVTASLLLLFLFYLFFRRRFFLKFKRSSFFAALYRLFRQSGIKLPQKFLFNLYCLDFLDQKLFKQVYIPYGIGRVFTPAIEDTYININLVPGKVISGPVLETTARSPQQLYPDAIFTNYNSALIFGGAGSGKTTISKHIFLEMCNTTINSGYDRESPPIPFFVSLLDFSTDLFVKTEYENSEILKGPVFFNFIERKLNLGVSRLSLDIIYDTAKTTGIALILDGLDEVADLLRTPVAEAIIDLIKLLQELGPQNKILVTSRHSLSAYMDSFCNHFESILYITPLPVASIYSYIQRLVGSGLALRKKEIENIYANIIAHPMLLNLCQNILNLSMYVAYCSISKTPFIPLNNTTLHSILVEEFFERRRRIRFEHKSWPLRSSLKENIYSLFFRRFLPNQKVFQLIENFLMDLAFHAVFIEPEVGTANSVSLRNAVRILKRRFSNEKINIDSEFLDVLASIANETGLLSFSSDKQAIRFLFPTICEYFCAMKIARNIEKLAPEFFEKLESTGDGSMSQRSYKKIAIFLCGMTKPESEFAERYKTGEFNENVISSLYRIGKLDIDFIKDCFLESGRYDCGEFDNFIGELKQRIIGLSQSCPEKQFIGSENYLRFRNLVSLYTQLFERAKHKLSSPSTLNLISLFDVSVFKWDLREDVIYSLIESIAKKDPIQAFGVAERFSVNLYISLPNLAIELLTNQEFLEFTIKLYVDNIHNEYSSSLSWLISEAALRDTSVFNYLREKKIPKPNHPTKNIGDTGISRVAESIAEFPWIDNFPRDPLLMHIMARAYYCRPTDKVYIPIIESCHFTKKIRSLQPIDSDDVIEHNFFGRTVVVASMLLSIASLAFAGWDASGSGVAPVTVAFRDEMYKASVSFLLYSFSIVLSVPFLALLIYYVLIAGLSHRFVKTINIFIVAGCNYSVYPNQKQLDQLIKFMRPFSNAGRRIKNDIFTKFYQRSIRSVIRSSENNRKTFEEISELRFPKS